MLGTIRKSKMNWFEHYICGEYSERYDRWKERQFQSVDNIKPEGRYDIMEKIEQHTMPTGRTTDYDETKTKPDFEYVFLTN